ncbi:response regulator [Chrysiogenes arsenatis]|uniref:response regulator n=1 Tax=Chrysiogenes arsenatis TaxID=309797 RepID=UPI000421E599|nr:two-component system response regulator [Chrysiogenes arsenatis]
MSEAIGITSHQHTVLIVDDSPENLIIVSGLLKREYKVKVANSGARALKIAFSDTPPDLILLDVMMPEMDGYEVCRQLKQHKHAKHIPVIFITAKGDDADEECGLSLGAVDYVTKPVNPPIVLARVKSHLLLKSATDALRDRNECLEMEVQRRTEEVVAIQDVTIFAFASLAETRDNDTGYHLRRTQLYVKTLAQKLQQNPRFCAFLTDENIELLFKSAPLHDIGKVGIPDSILMKPGRLTAEEFEIMKTHATIGRDAIVNAENHLGASVDFLCVAKDIAYGHHEKWDGSGYPLGLTGDEIPIAARLMAVADVYDALVNKRVYHDAMEPELVAQMIYEGRGKHFDPDVVDAFMDLKETFFEITRQYQ